MEEEIVAIEQAKEDSYFLSKPENKKWRNSELVVLEAVKVNYLNAELASQELLNKAEFAIKLLNVNQKTLMFLGENLMEQDFIQQLMKKDGTLLRYIHYDNQNHNIVLEAVTQNITAFHHAALRFKGDPSLIENAVLKRIFVNQGIATVDLQQLVNIQNLVQSCFHNNNQSDKLLLLEQSLAGLKPELKHELL